MGVIHKLKKEVVDFIILNKKETPSLSCRDLSLMVTDKFNIPVSKSSVNNILKKSELSSSVGRRQKSQSKNKKFYIPLDKKKQLKDAVQKIGKILETGIDSEEKKKEPEAPRPLPKSDASVAPNVTSDVHLEEGATEETAVSEEIRLNPVRRPKMEVKEIEEEGLVLPQEEDLKLRPDPVSQPGIVPGLEEEEPLENISLEAEEEVFVAVNKEESSLKKQFLKQINKIREKNAANTGFQTGAGLIILEAIQWSLSQNPLLISLMRKNIRGSISENFDDICKILTVAVLSGPVLAERMLSDARHLLWQIYGGVNKRAYVASLYEWMKKTEVPKSLLFEYSIEKEQDFLFVGAVSLKSSRGQVFYFDPQCVSSSSSLEGVSKNFVWPLQLCLNIWTNVLFKENLSLVFLNASEQIDRELMKELMMSLSGEQDRHLTQVCFYDKQNKEISCFNRAVKQKKSYIFAFWPWQDIFQDIKKTVKWAGRKCYYHRTYDQALYYAQTHTDVINALFDLSEGALETITVWRPEQEEPFLILVTNEENKSTEAVLEEFMSRWPYLEKGKAVCPYFNRESTPDKDNDTEERPRDLFVNEDFSFIKADQNLEGGISQEGLTVSDLFFDYAQSLVRYVTIKALPLNLNNEIIISDLFSRICKLKGQLRYYSTFVKLELLLEKDFPLVPVIEQIIQTVNEEFIHDSHNRRFFIEKIAAPPKS